MSLHIGAEPGQIAGTVLLPGDPLRARWIAQTYLDDVRCYSTVRNMLGFTGTFAGTPVSVQGTGMGQPSLSIYAHELMAEYGVRRLIRVGSCGALSPRLALRDIVLATTASTDAATNRQRFDGIDFAPAADFGLLRDVDAIATERGLPVRVGPIVSVDAFYTERPAVMDRLAEYGVLAVEMETNQLYTLAARFGAAAVTVLTVSDHLATGAAMTAAERERGFSPMAELVLQAAHAVSETPAPEVPVPETPGPEMPGSERPPG